MIEIVYVVFFWALIIETVLFIFLNIPSPTGVKGKIVNFLTTHRYVTFVMYLHLIFCILAAFFYLDLSQQQGHFLKEKQHLKSTETIGHSNMELRIGFLSYTILKIQRNKYITFMLIYTSIALNIFIQLLKHIYSERQLLKKLGIKLHKHSQILEPTELQSKINRESGASSGQAETDKRLSTDSAKQKKAN